MSNSCALTVFGILIGLGASAQAGPIDDCISGQVARRILVCTEAIQDDHLDDRQKAEAYDSRGTGYFAQGKLPEAISDFDQAARLKPDQASFRIHKGDACQLDQAIAEYNQAIQLAPGSSDGFIGRGTVRLHQQKLGSP
jgi:tetratricopeptide (TPR) repeat protein